MCFAQSGTTGSLNWSINDGTLIISGQGDMPDYFYINDIPWYRYQSSITKAEVSEGVTNLGYGAFCKCSEITSVTIPNSVVQIKDWVFQDCSKLVSVAIPAGVTNIGSNAFYGCYRLVSIDIEEGNQFYSSENGVLFNRDKTTLILYPKGKSGHYSVPESVINIEEKAFSNCYELTSITIFGNIADIGNETFSNCIKLNSISIPGTITSIGKNAFYRCGLTSIEIPNSVTNIGSFAFKSSALESIKIPEGVTSIGEGAFSICTCLTEVYIPESIVDIGVLSFFYCYSLKDIYVQKMNPPLVIDDTFKFIDTENCRLHVPAGSKQYYEIADVWKDFSNITEDIALNIENVQSGDAKMQLYPNPVQDNAILTIVGISGQANIQIFDSNGKMMHHSQCESISENFSLPVNVSDYPKGIYFIRVEAGSFLQTIKMIVK